jgi:hypothetical protein
MIIAILKSPNQLRKCWTRNCKRWTFNCFHSVLYYIQFQLGQKNVNNTNCKQQTVLTLQGKVFWPLSI